MLSKSPKATNGLFSQQKPRPRPCWRTRSLLAKFSAFIFILWFSSQLWKPAYFSAFQISDFTDFFLDVKLTRLLVGTSHQESVPSGSSLIPFTFHPLPLGSIKPSGWLLDQMHLMANGLAGHQFDFYPIVRDSPWLGGSSEYSGLNEGLPYWFNGLVSLAYGLDNSRLKAQVRQVSEYVLSHQQADGWLGPEIGANRDIWGRFPFLLGLCQLADADLELSPQIIPAIYRFVDLMHDMLSKNTGFHELWGRARYPGMLICLQWLFETHHRKDLDNSLDTMELLHQRGLSWADYYDEKRFIFGDLDAIKNPPITTAHEDFPFVHGVNAGEGLKAGAAIYRFTANESLLQSTRNGVKWTFAYHGDVAGSIIGDERESNLSPNRGSELCTAVETMYSLSYLYQVLGDNEFADRCELAAFNALPVMFTSNHWARQYITLANQPFSKTLEGRNAYWNVGDAALVYGPDTNYPCCTVNMPQGLPKFLSATFVQVGYNGLGHTLLSPTIVTAKLQNGVIVKIRCETNYPFSNVLQYDIFASSGFILYLRAPAWHLPGSSSLIIDGGAPQTLSADPHTGMTAIHLHPGISKVKYTLGANIRITHRANCTIAIYHGALLYALDLGQSSINAETHASPSVKRPWQANEYHYTNTHPWNIAIDPSTLKFHPAPPNTDPEERLESPIWSPGAPPSYMTARGCEIDWPLLKGMPAPVPLAVNGNRTCIQDAVRLVLRPYGSLKVHMAELPVVQLPSWG